MNDRQLPIIDDHQRRESGASGKQYWRSMEELLASPAGREFLQRDFPEHAAQWANALSRRQFLSLMGASLALAGIAGCSPQPPVGKIMPYTRQTEQLVPGKPQFFATAMVHGGAAIGLLVKSHEGRPTKVEGNPLHPASLGATDAFAQAAVLGLYDPDRSQSITYLGQPRGWSDAQLALRTRMVEFRKQRGKGLRILSETISSPTILDQLIGERGGSFLREFPEARWYQYEPTHSDASLVGSQLAFGEAVDAVYDLAAADVIVSLDADLFSAPAAGVRYTRDFMNRRGGAIQGKTGSPPSPQMNRLYVAESMPSIMGASADHRLPLSPSQIQSLSRGLAAQLGIAGVRAPKNLSDTVRRWITVVVKDLQSHRGACLVVAGDSQPPLVHALAHAMNDMLGNVGRTVRYIDPIAGRPADQTADMQRLVREMEAGYVDALFVLGANPVFTVPADLDFSKQLQRVPLRVHLGLYADETAAQSHWHIPQAHFLESWSDARSYDGTASIIQPLIAPLYGGRSDHELLSVLVDPAERPGYEIVRSYWREHWPGGAAADFERQWEQSLHDGIIPNTAFTSRQRLSLRNDWNRTLNETVSSTASSSDSFEIVFQSDPTIYDGRFANNGWLQELPKPITKITWDNAVFVSPALAERLGLNQTLGHYGGEHGQALVDRVELTLHGRKLEAPVWILPGHADHCVTVQFGYGRTQAGRVGSNMGFNAYAIRTAAAPWQDAGVTIRKLDQQYTLACTQMHHSMEGRDLVREGTIREFVADPQFLEKREDEEHRKFQHELVPGVTQDKAEPEADRSNSESDPRLQPLTVYPGYDYAAPKNKWGMAIDLTKCTGCSACVIACQAENNIPVVGKTEVTRGREMHWIRIDRYYQGETENPATYHQPVPCMHCENAPCELVCPVGATVHSADGLNDMVYNRCVGTRYCSNNCPYKVRRFNFFQYADFDTESLKAGRNPDVTVRSRGVMEKCTYCVQRIRGAQIKSEIDGQPISDGEVVTACQQACPAQAIVFGDMNDETSQVAQRKSESLSYALLAELNTRPRTTYLAQLRNPNPELE